MPFQSVSLEAATVIVCRLVFQREATTRESSEGLPSLCSGVVAVSGWSRTLYPISELPEAASVCSTESVGQPVNSTRRCVVSVDPRTTDTAYCLNHHIICEQAVVIRLCEAIRPAHCLTLLSPRLANHSAPIDARKTHIYQMQSELFIGYNSLNPKYYD